MVFAGNKTYLFLQILRAKNNKSSCGALRLRTRLQGANRSSLSANCYSPVVRKKGRLSSEVLYSLLLVCIICVRGRFFLPKTSPPVILTIFYLYYYGWRYGEDVQPLGPQRYDDCFALCQREDVQSPLHEVAVLHNVRGKTCSLFCTRQACGLLFVR